WAVGTIKETYEKYPEIGVLLPAMGYGEQQMKDLEKTINKIEADLVIIATPIDLGRIVKFNKPTVRVTYELSEIGSPTLKDILEKKFKK
ncbi:MAG TPA: GTPase, partial [Candidatus Kapabacteria bacterium]|nr:GTPase [Candidatus Kapabacteria bacterium]